MAVIAATIPLLSHLDIKSEDKTITVIENHLADANFIITHLLKQILTESENRVCFVIWHNTVGHYQNVLKRLGVDLLKKVDDGDVVILQGLNKLLEQILSDECAIAFQEEELFEEIRVSVSNLTKDNHNVYLVVDDFSHLFDIGLNLEQVLKFVNRCTNLTNNKLVSVVLGSHVSDNSDGIIVNSLKYTSDVSVVVSTLKTGRSRDVTGVIDVIRNRIDKVDTYHFQATEKEIKTFCPGQSLNFLYK